MLVEDNEPKASPFDRLRARFSTRPTLKAVLTLSLSKGEDGAGPATIGPAPNMANFG